MPRLSWLGRFAFRKSAKNPGRRNLPWQQRTLQLELLETRLAPASLQAVSLANPALHAVSAGAQEPVGVSNDGRYVAFESSSSNLVPGDNNNATDVFVRDAHSGKTKLVSVTLNGTSGNGMSYHAVMTPDGRYVAFDSFATNLTADTVTGLGDVFVRDLQSGKTTLVSANDTGAGGANSTSDLPHVTPNGRYILFESFAHDLIPGKTITGDNLYVRDVVANTTTLVTVNTTGTDGSNGTAIPAGISPDGRYVVFTSSATNLVNGFGDGNNDNVFVRDLVAGQTIPISLAKSGSGSGNGNSFGRSISNDGRYVAFESYATNLVNGDINNFENVYRRDLVTGTTSLVSVNLSGVSGNESSDRTSMSSDGRYVAFESFASDLVAGDNNNTEDIFVRDMTAGSTALVSVNSSGTGSANGFSFWPIISADGSSVAFSSDATNLVSGMTQSAGDIYLRNLTAGKTSLVSVNHSGTGGGNQSSTTYAAVLTATGSFVAFSSNATDLVNGVASGLGDVFLRKLSASTSTLVSFRDPSLPSLTGNGASNIQDPLNRRNDVSSNGRYVVFTSFASNLTTGVNNGTENVYRRDLWNRTTALVSVNQSGTGSGNGDSYDPSISADGRYVAFTSAASNLVSNDNNGATDVFVRDLLKGTTKLVSVNSSGNSSGNGASYDPVIAADGRYVVFDSLASNLVANDANNASDVFERDLVAQATALVSINPSGASGNASSAHAVVSSDGRYVAFQSYATDLVAGDTTSQQEVFLRDMVAGTTQVISATSAGIPGNSTSTDQVITPDGRYVAFDSYASNLASGVPVGQLNVYVRDVQLGTTTLVSVNDTNIGSGNGSSKDPVISDNGRYVAFDSAASNLVTNDANNRDDVFVRDLVQGTTTLVSINASGAGSGNGDSDYPAISSDGRYVAFESYASDLVQGAASLSNVYERDLSAGATTLLSPNNNSYAGEFDHSNRPTMTPTGLRVVFASNGNALVGGDFNQSTDVFLWSAAATRLVVSGFPSPSTAGRAGKVTVAALDAAGDRVTGYTGMVHFTSSDPQAVLPADYTFTTADAGQHTFSATLMTAGTQSLTATDTKTSTITGAQSGIRVNKAAAATTLAINGFLSPIAHAGAATFPVTAPDSYGNVAIGYLEAVHFTGSEPAASPPANYKMTPTDLGVHTFTATLNTSAIQSITATDTVTPGIAGTESGVQVTVFTEDVRDIALEWAGNVSRNGRRI